MNFSKASLFFCTLLIGTIFLSKNAFAAQTHPAGTLIQSGSVLWQISEDGSGKVGIDSAEKLRSDRLFVTTAVPANPADLALPVTGTLGWGDGVLFVDHGTIYQVSQGAKHGFVSANVFLGQGFSFNMAIPGDLSSLPEGLPIRQSVERHLPGTLLLSSSGIIFQQTSDSGSAFPSAAVFFSNGGKFSDVVPANGADTIIPNQLAIYRTGTIVNDNGGIWVTKQNSKFAFPSAPCFLNFGFTFTQTLLGSTKDLTSAGAICADAGTITPITSTTDTYNTISAPTPNGTFSVKIESFNLASGKIRVITDTAADADCSNNCATAPLSAYATANSAQAGMNGTYFCPSTYPDCAGKTGTFFWKVIDTKMGRVINATNGLGDNDPFFTFDSVGQFKYFPRYSDYANSGFNAFAGINSASIIENGIISLNYAKLDSKQSTVKGTQGALAMKGQTLYLLHVSNATVPDEAEVLKSLGMDYAILLDGGGSTAMIYNNSYVSGPGRNLANAVMVQVLP